MKYRFLRFPGFKTKALTFSYDDGYVYDKETIRILNKYGFRATFNLPGTITERTGELALTKEELLTLYNGHEVASHGEQHRALICQSTAGGIAEVMGGRLILEKFYGKIIRGFAYPDSGATNDEIKAYLKMLGIAYARVTKTTADFALPTDWLRWEMTIKHDDKRLLELAEKFLDERCDEKYCARRDALLFSVWGHASELKDKWHVLEEFCEKMSQSDDIWSATNIEIYEYTEAFRSLITSADEKIIHNPSNKTVYFNADGNNYKLEPDETIYFDKLPEFYH